MSNFDYNFKERVVRISAVFGLIFGILSIIGWLSFIGKYYYGSDFSDSLFFGIPLGFIAFISGLIHYKSHNPLGKFLPFATIFVYTIFFRKNPSTPTGTEFDIIWNVFLSVNICLVCVFLFGLLMNWIDKGN